MGAPEVGEPPPSPLQGFLKGLLSSTPSTRWFSTRNSVQYSKFHFYIQPIVFQHLVSCVFGGVHYRPAQWHMLVIYE